MTHFVLTPVGSSGDVHPYVGIGLALKARGHEVTVLTAEPFRDVTEANGLAFAPTQTGEDFEEVLRDPDLWHPLKGPQLMMRTVGQRLSTAFEALSEVATPESVVVQHPLALFARVYEDEHGGPASMLHLAPIGLRSGFESSVFWIGQNTARWPRWFKRGAMRLADRLLDPHIVPPLNQLRRSRGLPAVRRPFAHWVQSPRSVIGMFPAWFAAPQPDWPVHAQVTGFPLFDDARSRPVDPELERFLAAGASPVVFAYGTANRQAARFFAVAVAASRRLGIRSVLQTADAGVVPPDLPATVHRTPYAPFSTLLPRCAAIVHHAGIGTIAQGLAAGIPQISVPMAYDQPDNATRLARLGVGAWVTPPRLNPARLARVIDRVLEDRVLQDRCGRWRDDIRGTDPVAQTVQELERLGEPVGSSKRV